MTTQEQTFTAPAGLNPDTASLVSRFAEALADKLALAEQKYGYTDGWKSADWMDECRQKLVEHVVKGDPRDVAAYAAFLWHHGEPTSLSRAPIAEGGGGYQSLADRVRIEAGWFKPAGPTPATKATDRHALLIEAADTIEELADLNHKFKWQVRDTCVRAEKAEAAIEALSRQGGDMSKNPENLDTSAERVYGIDTSQVEYDRELIAKMLDELEPVVGLQHIRESVAEQARLLRAADNRDAAGVRTARASEAGDWVLVPREPNRAMIAKAFPWLANWKLMRKTDQENAVACAYNAMLAAAPAPGGG